MSKARWSGGDYHGPDLEDCLRLWNTLVEDYVSDLEIQIQLPLARTKEFRPRMVCRSPGFEANTGQVKWHTWGTKDLQAGFEAITYRQLFDLLIVSHRQIESALGGQESLPLP